MTETGETVYRRTYQRSGEQWPDTVRRVVDGNLALVPEKFREPGEADKLYGMILNGQLIPAGRQLYMTGVESRQFLFNCFVSGWTETLSEHFTFTFLRLMEGGGVGANYSAYNMKDYKIKNMVKVELFCSPDHPDYEELKPYLSPNKRSNCWVIPDSREGWALALEATIDFATGGQCCPDANTDHVGVTTSHARFDLSNIRPRGAEIKTFGGTAAGPLPLAKLLHTVANKMNEAWLDTFTGPIAMDIDQAISECVVSGNVRRSARMSIMHWNDPYIHWFLFCKTDVGDHWSTNISVEIDDEFISILESEDGDMRVDPILQQRVREIWRQICSGMLKNGEPGIWNSSLSNIGEPNRVSCTNPCAEIALEAFEACNLGHINLAGFVTPEGVVDYVKLYEAHRLMTRMLIRSTFGDVTDEKQKEVMDRNRRIGVGHLGFQWFVNAQGIKYSESHKDYSTINLLDDLKTLVDKTARLYSHDLRIPTPVKTTTVAPTGSVAKLFGVSEGIHPIFAGYFLRRIRFSTIDPNQIEQVNEYRRKGYSVIDDPMTENTVIVEIASCDPIFSFVKDHSIIESVDQISMYDLLSVQRMYQDVWADNAVSFTVNVTDGRMDTEGTMAIIRPFLHNLKGLTVMVDMTRPLSPYERITKEEFYDYTDFYNWSVESFGDGSCASGACPVR